MEEKFINRTRELKILESQYQSPGSSFVVMIGRRRMGKTSLLMEFAKNKENVIYYFADKDAELLQINKLKNNIATWAKDDLLMNVQFNHWDEPFRYLQQKMLPTERLVLIIDEFQFLAMVNQAVPSILQRLWDMELKNKNIMLILCGSHVSMMYKTTLSYGSPLYGRRTASIQLKPIAFNYMHGFFPEGTPLVTIVEYYAITSGIPKYIEMHNKQLGIFENIENLILTKDAFFYNEPRFILGEELKDQFMHFSILRTIASGSHKPGNIASSLNETSNKLSPYLEVLKDIELVERKVPVTEPMPQKSRKGLYFMKDYFMRFWFRYVFQYQHLLEIGKTEWVLAKIKQEFNQFVSLAFEDICRQILPFFCPFPPMQIGAWWEKEEEMDMIAYNDETKEIMFGECKWTEQPVDITAYIDLKAKSKKVTWNNESRKEYFILFAKKGFTKGLEQVAKEEKSLVLINFSSSLKFTGNNFD